MAITELSSLEYNEVLSAYPSLVKIDDTHFILAYADTDSDGQVTTFSMNGSYELTAINTLEFDTTVGQHNSLVKIDATHFMIAHTGSAGDGFLRVLTIDGSYNISATSVLEHDTADATYNSLVMIDSTHFILAYSGTGTDGFIKTFSIDGAYAITQIASLEHDTSYAADNSLVMIDSTHFALAYRNSSFYGQIKVFAIDGSYAITEVETLQHDGAAGYYNSLCLLDSTHLVLAYTGADGDAFIKTFSIDGSYQLTEIDSLEHDTANGAYNSIVKLDATHVALAFQGLLADGYVKVFSFDGSYQITEDAVLEHDTADVSYNSLCAISSSHVVLAYTDASSDGFIKVFSTGLTSTTNATIDGLICPATTVGIDATVTITQNATISGVIAEATTIGIDATVSVIVNATITGVIAPATTSGIDATVTITQNATISGVISPATTVGIDATVTLTQSATIVGVIAEAIAYGIDATVSGQANATIQGIIAEAIAGGIDAFVGVVTNATISGLICEAVASGINGTVGLKYTASVEMTGSGLLEASAIVTKYGVIELTGTGTLEATGLRTVHGTTGLTGSGLLEGVGLVTKFATTSMTGTGTLTATGETKDYSLPGAPIITITANMKMTMDSYFIANQGETVCIIVNIDPSLVRTNHYAYVDFFLPDGTIITKGKYNYDIGSFPLVLGQEDIALMRDGLVGVQCSIVEIDGTRNMHKRNTNKIKTRILRSILANEGNRDISYGAVVMTGAGDMTPTPPEYIYASTNNQFADARIYKLSTSDLSVVGSVVVATTVYDMVGDGDNLYGRGEDQGHIAKYDLVPAFVDEEALGGSYQELYLCEEGDYVYVTTQNTNKLFKYSKSGLSLVTSVSVDSISRYIDTDSTYLYSTHGNKKIYKSRLSDLTKVAESATMDWYPQSLVASGAYVFAHSSDLDSAHKLYKFNTTDMSTATSISTGSTYYRWMCCDDSYVYGIGEDYKIYKHNISNLALVDWTSGIVTYSINGIIEKDGYLYCGGDGKVRKFSASTLDLVAESDDFVNWVWAVAL